MADGMRGVSTTLRAHVKVHKSPHIARQEIEYGAVGVGCATVWEAIVMVRAGIDDVFVINEVVGAEKTRALALLAREASVKVAVDDTVQIDELSPRRYRGRQYDRGPHRRRRGDAPMRCHVGRGCAAARAPDLRTRRGSSSSG